MPEIAPDVVPEGEPPYKSQTAKLPGSEIARFRRKIHMLNLVDLAPLNFPWASQPAVEDLGCKTHHRKRSTNKMAQLRHPSKALASWIQTMRGQQRGYHLASYQGL